MTPAQLRRIRELRATVDRIEAHPGTVPAELQGRYRHAVHSLRCWEDAARDQSLGIVPLLTAFNLWRWGAAILGLGALTAVVVPIAQRLQVAGPDTVDAIGKAAKFSVYALAALTVYELARRGRRKRKAA